MKKLKLLRVVGARPQFMQVKPLRRELESRGHKEILLHTGQHYDDTMSKQFFTDLELPEADINLGVGSGSHGQQTAAMIKGIEEQLLVDKFDAVVVDGDTNSTFAGALAAVKLHIPVIHIEAGMRSFDKKMPEEINRTLTDHSSTLLFCPTEVNKRNLNNEGITKGVYVVGDLLAQCFYEYQAKAGSLAADILAKYNLTENNYVLLTLHRAENVDNKERIEQFLKSIITSPYPVVWPLHPRTKKMIEQHGLSDLLQNKVFHLIPPIGYLEMLALEGKAIKILTDSGGVQREAYHWEKPCTILRDSTEWVEIIDTGWAKLYKPGENAEILWDLTTGGNHGKIYGSTEVAKSITDIIEEAL
ncbi:non-hydrolyzing UDP-N-acetylglucosamine 2-epimerase [Schinkia azotoformans]|uniref:non-hydrolyzing UDP-N-acetylglucosamine 2-epimerase n=1 Tax=Schinkia azotoformans TaxID=1454 RepID=UPI002DB70DC1|nr:UDP-N-acetylglucosamine 2-epimerase (non-hydrolyzing) [Schinkia azotoformans]MEC1719146.1 UDP-N-acetylglucosamine 2-epimerase (non-hydrolyzing) [Schinkia azotoformans]MED4413806.1 UDP-N-acetylglucosamine 2-epimerase (non-hydrolyzing) [Schinkia azotoformans]